MYEQVLDPVGGSLFATALFGARQVQEGELFRRVLGWSLVLLLVMCVLVLLQSLPILSWMVV